MKKIEITVYSFDELSDEAKERALADWNRDNPYNWDREFRDTLEAFEREFGVEVVDWEYSPYDHDFSFRTGRIDSAVLELEGNRARAWFWNNHERCLLTGRYYSKFHGTKHAHSKFFFDRVYDGTCPWTGFFLDCSALDPIAYFCFGVEWDEKLKRRVPIRPTKAEDDANTVETILYDCVESLFDAVEKDWAYQCSMEAFKEACDANDYTFDADGKMHNV